MKMLTWFAELLYPRKCLLCRKVLEREELDLCHRCRAEAPDWAPGRVKYPFLASLTAVWYYEKEVRGSILRYKFGGCRSYAEGYARLLAMAVEKAELQFDLITWIPISPKRLRKRGFDQVQLLAEHLSRELGVEAQPLLIKTYDNPPQSHIVGRAQRRANVLGVYKARSPELVKDQRILLLDDIITTGATAGECARVLLTAGAKEVHCAVIAAARQHKLKR